MELGIYYLAVPQQTLVLPKVSLPLQQNEWKQAIIALPHI